MYEMPSNEELKQLYPNSELDWETLRLYHIALPIADAIWSRVSGKTGDNHKFITDDAWRNYIASMFIHYQKLVGANYEPNK